MRHITLAIFCMLLIINACKDTNSSNNPTTPMNVSLTLMADNLSSPLILVEAPDNSGRLFVVDQPGKIYIIKNGSKMADPFLDIQSKVIPLQDPEDERGLLGLAFHPDFKTNGRFFVYYSKPLRSGAPSGWNCTNYLAEYTAPSNADKANPDSEKILLAIDKPQANHNAGMIAFGSDGYLYMSVGDGGGANDKDMGHVDDWYAANAGGNGQDITQNLLGSILRIDVNTGSPYTVPGDNPFVGKDGLDEIYAFGFRNPYRFCFDPNNNIVLADAGQDLYEEIDVVTKGGNYGWNVKEGRHCFNAADSKTSMASCPSSDQNGNPLIDPVIEIKNSNNFPDGLGIVSIGGFVYQGTQISGLSNKYIFGIFAKHDDSHDGSIYAANRSGNDWSYSKLAINGFTNGELGEYVLGFGQDSHGEVYVLTKGTAANSGKAYRIDK